MKYLEKRLSEPSTWAGWAILCDGVARYLAGDKSGALQAMLGAVSVFMKEGPK